jgi:hypothetical protein
MSVPGRTVKVIPLGITTSPVIRTFPVHTSFSIRVPEVVIARTGCERMARLKNTRIIPTLFLPL